MNSIGLRLAIGAVLGLVTAFGTAMASEEPTSPPAEEDTTEEKAPCETADDVGSPGCDEVEHDDGEDTDESEDDEDDEDGDEE